MARDDVSAPFHDRDLVPLSLVTVELGCDVGWLDAASLDRG